MIVTGEQSTLSAMPDGDKDTNRLTRQVLRLLDENGFTVEIRQDREVVAVATRNDEEFRVAVVADEHDAPRYVAVCRLAEACGISLEE